jgi:5-methylcytosine-specific restriction endonuclease McrA
MPGDSFYSSAEWRTARRAALKRDRYRCVICRADVAKLGTSRVDHILPRKRFPRLALSLSNLRTLCARCDTIQALERLERKDAPRFERVDENGETAAWRADPAADG